MVRTAHRKNVFIITWEGELYNYLYTNSALLSHSTDRRVSVRLTLLFSDPKGVHVTLNTVNPVIVII